MALVAHVYIVNTQRGISTSGELVTANSMLYAYILPLSGLVTGSLVMLQCPMPPNRDLTTPHCTGFL